MWLWIDLAHHHEKQRTIEYKINLFVDRIALDDARKSLSPTVEAVIKPRR